MQGRSTQSLSKTDKIFKSIFMVFAWISASMIIVVAVFVLARGIMPFITDNKGLGNVDIARFLTGRVWLSGETFVSTAYGAGFLVINTLYVATLALLIAFPIGVLTALYIAKIAPPKLSELFRTIIELLTAIPSIVFGLVGVGVILPFVYRLAGTFGISSGGGNSTMATVIVLATMIMPTLTAISEVAIRSVDKKLEEASLALGATHTQTHFKVVLISAKSGIFSGAILAVGRALGEATAVSLVAGNARSGPTFNLFGITSTLTSTMLQGLKETTGIDYDIRFSLGIVLMIVIIITNMLLNAVKRKVGNFDAS